MRPDGSFHVIGFPPTYAIRFEPDQSRLLQLPYVLGLFWEHTRARGRKGAPSRDHIAGRVVSLIETGLCSERALARAGIMAMFAENVDLTQDVPPSAYLLQVIKCEEAKETFATFFGE